MYEHRTRVRFAWFPKAMSNGYVIWMQNYTEFSHRYGKERWRVFHLEAKNAKFY